MLELLHEVHSHRPHACPLAVDVHGDRGQQDDELDDADPDENRLGPVVLEPPGDEEAEDQPVQDVLAEVERHERLSGVLSVAVHAKGDSRRGAERAPERDDAEEHRRHDPGVLRVGGPSEPDQPEHGGDGDGDGHDQSELGFVEAAVSPSHRLDDDVADFPGDGRAQDTADEGCYVDEAGGQSAESVIPFAVDDGDAFGNDDQPAHGAGVDGR